MSSRAVGGSSSSGRIGRLFSFILSIVLLFGASGAWAADWTDASGNEYTALKYIKGNGSGSSGGPYIITDFKPVSNSTVKLRFKPTTVSGNECLFCSRKKVSNKVSDSMSGFRISNKIRLDRRHTDRYETCNTTTLAAENDYSLSADFSGSGTATTGIATINGVDQTLSGVLGNVAYTPASKLTLFASHEDANVSESSTFDNKGSFYLYYFQLYSPDDGSLAHNLMPAKNSSGVAGLYDTVTRTFYGPTGPSGYTTFTSEDWGTDRAGKKWTGLGGDNLMSTAANWEGGVAPQAGDNIDFTIAVPFAAIVADIDATFGKIYLGTGDLPAFSGALSATGINDLERMTAYDTATDGFAFTLAAPSGQDFTWNGGAAANWNTTDASWLYNNAASVWYDYNNAIFSTENATATLTENAIAASLSFTQPATIVGSAVLTVPAVSVAPNVSATISAPTAGALEKTGEGTLTLGSSRTDQTTVSEGTLAMSGSGTTLDWSKLTLGTDPEKPVTVRFEAGAAPTSGDWYLGSGNITSTVVKASGDWARGDKDIHIGSGVGADTTFIHEGGSLTCSRFIRVGTRGAANSTLILSGGVIKNTNADRGSGKEPRTAIGYTSNGTLIVTNGASLAVTGQYLGISDANRMKGIVEIYDGSTVDVAYDVIFGQVSQQGWGEGKLNLHAGGTLATQVIRCSTNYATPADATAEVNFDGGILKAKSSTRLIQKHDRLTVNVSAKGGTINNNGKNIIIEESFNGPGMIDLTGSGKTTFAAGVGVDAEGGVYVDTGTTLTINGTTTSCLGTLILKEGSTLDIATPVSDVAAFAATELLIPAEGKVTLTSGGGAFVEGLYAICKMSGVTPEAGAKFAPSTGELAVSWSVVGDMLMLEVGDVKNTWTGAANDGDLSNHDNWYGREVPTSGNCIIGNVSGADLTVGAIFAATSITFPAGSGPITISGERTLSGITAIVNNAPVHHVFNCPIVCADGVTPDITRGKDNYMTFAGGITMYDTPKTGGGVVDYWSGNVTLTTESPVTYATNGDQNYGWLVSGTTFTFNNGKIDHMYIDAGATAVVERLVYHNTVRNNKSGSKTAYYNEVFDNGNGTIRTKEVKNTGTAVLFHSYADSDMVGGTIIAEKLTCATTVQTGGGFPYPVFMLNCGTLSGTTVTTGAANGEGVWVIGPGGLAFGETIHARSHFETKIGKSLGGRPAATLHSYADWTLQASPNGRNTTALSIGSGNDGFIVIDTSHYAIGEAEYDSATSHTVTLDGQIVGGPMRVEGNGKVVFANEYNTFSGLTVTDTATASVKAGCKPGTGAVTLEAGTILEVAESGTATIDGVLTLADGAALAFNFTDRKTPPQLALSLGNLTANGAVNVKISGEVWPTGGEKLLTTCGGFDAEGVTVSLAEGAPKWAKRVYVNEDGNIVLDVKPRGTRVIVR